MIPAKVTERAEILIPNKEHKSFTRTNTFIEPGTDVVGKATVITGLRKGQPFDYRLFEIKKNNFIYLNKTNLKPTEMKSTEVKLGADAQRQPTIINEKPSGFSISNHPKAMGAAVGALAGGIIGWAYSHHLKHEPKMKKEFAVKGAVLFAAIGFGVGAYIQHRRAISITAPMDKKLV